MINFTIHDAPQGSEQWLSARAGKATGSRAKDILATIKTGEAAARRDYRMQLAVERLTAQPQGSDFVNQEMQRGIDLEPAARAAYEALTGNMVQECGFISRNDIEAGCSLDGHVDNFLGIVEFKCPKSATHYRYLKTKDISEYLPQIRHNLWVTGAQWCDALSFDNRFPEPLQTYYQRFYAKDLNLLDYEMALIKFLKEVDEETAEVRSLYA